MTVKNAGLEKQVAVFTLRGSEGKDRVFRFQKDRIVIGSVVSADIRLGGADVSPLHAVIEFGGDSSRELGASAVIFDLASESGVLLNGSKVVTSALQGGDQIKIGSHDLFFKLEAIEQVSKVATVSKSAEGRTLFSDSKEDTRPLLLINERDVQPIFDYRGTDREALEVVMSWNRTILDVKHFTKAQTITVGSTARADFGVPPILGSGDQPFVQFSQTESRLSIYGPMKGVVQSRGRLSTLQDLARSGGGQVSLGVSDFAKITIGEIDFYLSYTKAPPRLKSQRLFDRDPLMMKILISSFAISAGLVFGLSRVTVVKDIEPEELTPRIATILYTPEKFPAKKPAAPKPPPPPEQKKPDEPKPPQKVDLAKQNVETKTTGQKAQQNSQNQAKGGAGAKASGAAGSRGSQNAKNSGTPQEKATRPTTDGGAGPGGAKSEVAGQGNLEALKASGASLSNLLAGAGQKLGAGGDQLKGFGGFDTRGNGGKALGGSGKGGGGEVESLGGLGGKGQGGGRVGTGMGAAGDGTGIVGGKSRIVLQTGTGDEAVVMGSIDAEAIEAAIRRHKDEFALCYEREINAQNPNLAGRVGTAFVIGPTGRVVRAAVSTSTLGNANAERCILDVLKRIEFPVPKGGTTIEVNYPFKFSPTGR